MSELDFAAGLQPLSGGYSGETFLGTSGGEQVVVRIYGGRSQSRGPTAVDIDAAVLRLVRGLLPVPEVLEVRRPDAAGELPAVLVTSRLPGTRLDLVLPEADAGLRRALGVACGDVLARLSGMPMLRSGPFVDADLRIGDWGADFVDLPSFVESQLVDTALAAWSAEEQRGLVELADRAQDLLDGLDRTCLVHSDFNPKNLLVDPDTAEVTGLLDWEFAHAGSPAADLGNLVRFDRDPDFVTGVLERHRPDGSDGPLELARAADMVALVELAGRPGDHDVARRAHDLLRARARAGDLHATVDES